MRNLSKNVIKRGNVLKINFIRKKKILGFILIIIIASTLFQILNTSTNSIDSGGNSVY